MTAYISTIKIAINNQTTTKRQQTAILFMAVSTTLFHFTAAQSVCVQWVSYCALSSLATAQSGNNNIRCSSLAQRVIRRHPQLGIGLLMSLLLCLLLCLLLLLLLFVAIVIVVIVIVIVIVIVVIVIVTVVIVVIVVIVM